jgi:hypothetical protein
MRNQREREEDRYGLVALSRFVSRAVDLMKRRWRAATSAKSTMTIRGTPIVIFVRS